MNYLIDSKIDKMKKQLLFKKFDSNANLFAKKNAKCFKKIDTRKKNKKKF